MTFTVQKISICFALQKMVPSSPQIKDGVLYAELFPFTSHSNYGAIAVLLIFAFPPFSFMPLPDLPLSFSAFLLPLLCQCNVYNILSKFKKWIVALDLVVKVVKRSYRHLDAIIRVIRTL